ATYPFLAAAAGKDGRLFLFNPLSLTPPLSEQQSEACWCGPSLFMGSDGVNRIVASQGSTVRTWQVSSPTPTLSLEGTATITSGQDPGFFTSVSSNGTTAGSAIIWAVSRPSNTTSVNLYAFSAGGTLTQLFSSPAGTWPNTGGNANIVPVVANGKVYVASYKALTILGPGAPLTQAAAQKALRP